MPVHGSGEIQAGLVIVLPGDFCCLQRHADRLTARFGPVQLRITRKRLDCQRGSCQLLSTDGHTDLRLLPLTLNTARQLEQPFPAGQPCRHVDDVGLNGDVPCAGQAAACSEAVVTGMNV